ncbi:hypothetical protein [Tritonibacter mobilis]|uniref:hypothetical protein n=1 Tax=Tritonibacter mobilis TaxID=379347 RepID=UPI000F7F7B44|nr:hypothetical protein [Tritonibacter mobilis]
MADLFGENPHHERHPLTGVVLNVPARKRRALTFAEAVTVHILYIQGVEYTDIVYKLGTNPYRIGEVLKGEIHPAAQTEAYRLLTQH